MAACPRLPDLRALLERTPCRLHRAHTTGRGQTRADDGRIRVENACRNQTLDGEWNDIEGIAWPTEPGDFSRLKLQFFWPLRGDYWVLALDPGYRWALVGHPNREYLWVLARTRTLDESVYAQILALAGAQGYDVTQLRRTPQPAD
mgnify:CR=1 FL=1